MSMLVVNCPRCKAQKSTFDLRAENWIGQRYDWQNVYEVYGICRNCGKGTIFVVEADISNAPSPMNIPSTINDLHNVESFVSLKDFAAVSPPEYLPEDIHEVFVEGAQCLAVGCPNAAATMFRASIDRATRPLLPDEDMEGLNRKTRRDLGLRLPWLFEHGYLPEGLRELSDCIREEGNDGAHQATLSIEDAEDVLDFTYRLLDRLYSEPARLAAARERREERRRRASGASDR